MLKKLKRQKGFTLVEMLISMAIFTMFVGIIIGSYTSIVTGQRDANEYRIMYVEARTIFETLVFELRNGMVDYKNQQNTVGPLEEIVLVSKDAKMRTKFVFEEGAEATGGSISMQKIVFDSTVLPVSRFDNLVKLNNEVRVKAFKFYVSPAIDPYDPEYVAYDQNQFQPKVTIYAKFEKLFGNGKTYEMTLQTTVSSRIYNQVY